MTIGTLILECCQVIYDMRFDSTAGVTRDAMKVSLHMAIGQGWKLN